LEKVLDVEEFLEKPGVYAWRIETLKSANIWELKFIYKTAAKKIYLSLAGAEYEFTKEEFKELIETMERILAWVKRRAR